MREVVFDTETTGLDPRDGHRLVEIAAIEMIGRMPTGRFCHFHFNPERSMPREAEMVHGLTEAFLADKPRFAERAAELLAFLGDSMLVAHNARFDFGFLNFELERIGMPRIDEGRMIDTLEIARRRFPGAKHSLDALCTRFGIDRSARVLHGARIDTELLADVYIELTGGRQIGFDLAVAAQAEAVAIRAAIWPRRFFSVPDDELRAHRAFIGKMHNPVWALHPAYAAAEAEGPAAQ